MKEHIGRTLIIIYSLVTVYILQGCTTVITSSAQAAYAHRDIQNSVQDQLLAVHVDRAVHWYTDKYKSSNVSVSVFNNIVVLTGQVPSSTLRTELTDVVKKVPDVSQVYNLTTLSNPVSSITQISDSWITTKIKTQIIAELELDPSKIKVITENGTVYLIGIVFPDQAVIATDIARETSGVQNVVKIFSYLEITKHLPKPHAERVG
ncbi:MAG: BON domain-containing protein [Pseudomonadota bacterium]